MKTISLITLGVCLTWLAGVVPAAQPRETITLSLPYALEVGTVSVPAGECTITNMETNGRETRFMLRSEAGASLFVTMDRAEKFDSPNDASPAVQMRRNGSNYELQGITIDGKSYRVN
jgi:hypothetical protein